MRWPGRSATPVFDALRDARCARRTGRAGDGRSTAPGIGAKLLVEPGPRAIGTLGDPDLDRVVARDALGELEAGLTVARHYGAHGEARTRRRGVHRVVRAASPTW